LVLVLVAITGVAALAETISKEVRFNRPVTVNGTTVKAGIYKVSFDDQTGELSIFKGKKLVAKGPARLEKLEKETKVTYTSRVDGGALLSVNLKNGNLAVLETGARGQDSSQQQ
jgi:hypothetical protein